MEALTGQLAVVPDLPAESLDRQKLIEELNEVISPKETLTLENVYLGILHAASNQVNLQGGCFEESELRQLATMLVDAPVMIGHQKHELPLGRVFKADIVDRDGEPWLRAFFYWSRSHRRAVELRRGIDSGVYRECSLGFLYDRPECAICREDMRRCRHRVNESVQHGSRKLRAFYYYKEIKKVLEISLVYRGAIEGTAVSTLAAESEESSQAAGPFWRNEAEVIYSIEQLKESAEKIWVEPIYQGVWLKVAITPDKLSARMPNGETFDFGILRRLRKCFSRQSLELLCQIVPTHGSSRLPLRKLPANPSSHKLRIYIADLLSYDGIDLRARGYGDRRELLKATFTSQPRIRLLPALKCHLQQLEAAIATRASADGLRLIGADAESSLNVELRLHPYLKIRLDSEANREERLSCTVGDSGNTTELILTNLPAKRYSPGSILIVKPFEGSHCKFEFVDIALGETNADNSEALQRLRQTTDNRAFTLFREVDGDAYLLLQESGEQHWIRISQLNTQLLTRGRHFWASLLSTMDMNREAVGRITIIDKGTIIHMNREGRGVHRLRLCGSLLAGEFVLATTKRGESSGYLFSQTDSNDTESEI